MASRHRGHAAQATEPKLMDGGNGGSATQDGFSLYPTRTWRDGRCTALDVTGDTSLAAVVRSCAITGSAPGDRQVQRTSGFQARLDQPPGLALLRLKMPY